MRNDLKENTKIKLISLLSAIVLWMYVMVVIDPRDTKLFENIPVNVTNIQELEENDLVVYPEDTLVADIYITANLSDLQKVSEDDINIYGSVSNPIEGQNHLYLKVNTTKQVSYELKSDFIVVELEKLIRQEKEINIEISGKYKDDVDTITLEQSSVDISGPRVLTDEVESIKTVIIVDSKDERGLNQNVKLIPVNSQGKEVKGVKLDVKNINAKVTLLEEKEVPIKIQLKDDSINTEGYEISPKSVKIKGKRDKLDTIDYINTEQIDEIQEGNFKKVQLIAPQDVTLYEGSVVINHKQAKNIIKQLSYSNSEVKLRNNTQNNEIIDFDVSETIDVEVQLEEDIDVSKSDITLYIDLKDKDNLKIQYESNLDFVDVKITPETVKE